MPSQYQRFQKGKPPPLTIWQRIKKWMRNAGNFVTIEVIKAVIAVIVLSLASGYVASRAGEPSKPWSESQQSKN